MKLSSQKDLLLVIILSMVVLILSWLQLFKGYTFTFITIILVLFLPGYAIVTAIWPTGERMGWGMRIGLGFVIGLFFLLFLPLILNSLNLGSISDNLNNILFILAILLSLLAMFRRPEMEWEEEPEEIDTQLTLEESIERAAWMRQQPMEEHESTEYEEYNDHESYLPEDEVEEHEETHPDYEEEEEFQYETDDNEEEIHEDDELELSDEEEMDDLDYEAWKEKIKNQKPLQYQRIQEKYEEEPVEHHPLRVEKPVRTEHTPSDYEKEMDTPVWNDEPPEKKSGFKYWDILFILFLSGISLLFLYFNPLKNTTTSMIFFTLLLFIMGYAGITIIFPDKSRASSRDLIITSSIIAVILFALSFLACMMQLLPSVPLSLVQIMIIVSVILVVGAFLRKWRASDEGFKEEDLEEDDLHTKEEIPEEEKERTQKDKSSEEEKKDPFAALKSIGKSLKIDESEIIDEPIHQEKEEKRLFGGSKWEHILSIILIIVLILAIASTVYIIVKPKEGEKFTEFYILGPNGTASNYPTNLTMGQNGTVIIGVVNHEYKTTDYRLMVKVNGNTLKNDTITLTNNQTMEIPFSFTAGTTGQKKMEFLLYKLPDNETAYRSLHLWLNVK